MDRCAVRENVGGWRRGAFDVGRNELAFERSFPTVCPQLALPEVRGIIRFLA
jgi:hypothetical protein